MNLKTIKSAFIIGFVVISTFNACNRSNSQTWQLAENITATLSGGTLTISGSGAILGTFDEDGRGDPQFPWDDYRKEITDVIIGENVTEIGWGAFWYSQISNITIGNSVIEIGESAFSNNQLTNITIPNNVRKIGLWAFDKNPLNSITIGTNVELRRGAYEDFYEVDNIAGFYDVYNSGGKQAGTYTLNNGVWSLLGNASASTVLLLQEAETWQDAYTKILKNSANIKYDLFSQDEAEELFGTPHQFYLYDIDYDGVPELFIDLNFRSASGGWFCAVYSYRNGVSVQLDVIQEYEAEWRVPLDSSVEGLFLEWFTRGINAGFFRVYIYNGSLKREVVASREWYDDTETYFRGGTSQEGGVDISEEEYQRLTSSEPLTVYGIYEDWLKGLE